MADEDKKEITVSGKKNDKRNVKPAEEKPPEPQWLFYVLSFFVQVAGIVIGAIYMGKPGEECRRFGKNCIIAAVIPFLIYCLCIYIYILFIIAYVLFYILFMAGLITVLGVSGGGHAFMGALAVAGLS